MESTPPFGRGFAFCCKIRAHGADEFARAVRARRQRVGDLLRGFVADAELFLVDKGVVDAVDHQLAQDAVLHAGLELIAGNLVSEAERFKEILINNIGAGGDDGIHHVVANQVDKNLLQTGTEISDPARQRMTPQSWSRSIRS